MPAFGAVAVVGSRGVFSPPSASVMVSLEAQGPGTFLFSEQRTPLFRWILGKAGRWLSSLQTHQSPVALLPPANILLGAGCACF